MSDSREQCLNCQHDRSVHSIAGCSLCECRTPLLSGGNPTEVSAPSPSLSAREEAERQLAQAVGFSIDLFSESKDKSYKTYRYRGAASGFVSENADIVKLWNFAVALLQRPAAMTLIESARDLLEACYQADAKEELPPEIDGKLLDRVREGLIQSALLQRQPAPLTDREREDVTNPVCDPDKVPDYNPRNERIQCAVEARQYIESKRQPPTSDTSRGAEK